MVNVEVTSSGELSLEGQIAGRIQGFRFTPEANGRAELTNVDDAERASAIAREFEVRANRLSEAVDSALVLANDGAIRWLGEPIAKIAAGDSLLAPRALLLADETLTEAGQHKAQARVDLWLAAYVRRLLGPLFELESGVGLEGAARAVALRLVENLGVLERGRVAQDVKALDQNARGLLRKLGVRFGAYYIYVPALVKPAIRVLATQLWALRQGGSADGASVHEIPQLAASGRTSFLADSAIPKETYRVAGFRLCGDRAVRVDIVERLADLIRPAVAYRSGASAGAPPPGSADGDGFVVTGAMTSLTGCSGEQFASVLRSLGFVSHLVKGPALTPAANPPEALAGEGASQAPEAVPESGAEAGESPLAAISDGGASAEEGAHEPAHSEASSGEPPTPADDAASRQAADLEDEAVDSPQVEALPAWQGAPVVEAAPGALAAPGEPLRGVADEGGLVAGHPPVADAAEAADEAAVSEPPAPEAALNLSTGLAPQEPVAEALIAVWRPRPPIRQRGPRGGRDRTPTQAAHGEPQPAHRSQPGDEAGPRRRRPSPRPAPRPAVEAESAPNPESDRPRSGRGARRPSDSAIPAQGSHRARGEANPGNGRDERGRRERRPEAAPTPVARREPPINLDSPFAKLLALKLQLETKGKGE